MNRYQIIDVKGREVLDSRGNPTVEVEIWTDDGYGRATVPSGASTGENEAIELRDEEDRYNGKGVKKAVEIVNQKIAPELIGYDITDQRKIDNLMLDLDGTKNKLELGANSILGVSMAASKAAADLLGIPLYSYISSNSYVLPVPMANVINGGEHAGNDLEFQEFMVMPTGAKSFSEGIRMVAEVYHELRKSLANEYGKGAINVGDEGGYAPLMKEVQEPFEMLLESIEELGYEEDMNFAIDAAASEIYNERHETYPIGEKEYEKEELIELYKELVDKYNLISIEDPFHEEEFDGFKQITEELDIQIVGDDLFVTNVERLEKGIEMNSANSLLLKVNQIGTISEAIDAAQKAFRSGYSVVVSHRSGETEDTTIADLSVGLNSGQIKTGAPARTDRNVKYNRLLRIEEQLGEIAKYPGENFKDPF